MKAYRATCLTRLSLSDICLAFVICSIIGCGGTGNLGSSNVATPEVKINSISPKEIPLGSGAVTVTVSGTGFTSESLLLLNGVVEPTVFVSSTQLQATVAPAQLQTGQVLGVAVRTGSVTANASTGTALQVDNPVPTISAVAPAAALLGAPSTSITITGSNYVVGVVATVNGNPRPTTFVSDTQMSVLLPATDFTQAGSLLLNVTSPQPGGGASGTTAFTVNNPLPAVTSISPSAVQVGSAAAALTVNGSGFVPGTGVLVNGAWRAATYVSSITLMTTVTPADQSFAGALAITAVNPAPGGGVSASAALTINNPVPGALTISPGTLLAGTSGPTLLTVTGVGFVPSTLIQINGNARLTTYVSPAQLVATISSADQAIAGVLAVAAVTAGPGGGSSPTANLTVNNPAPGSILVTPNLVSTGTLIPTAITITGANFVPSTVVQVSGSARTTTYISSTQLLSALTVADQAIGGSLSINALTPAPGGGVSSAASIAVSNPTLGSLTLSPSSVPAGTNHNTVITVTGTEFLPGTSIQVNGAVRATTYVSPTQVTFVLLVADSASAAKLSIMAVNPAPVSNTSPATTLTVATPTLTPSVTSLKPSAFILGAPTSSLTVTGTNFNASSVVLWNGTALTTTFLNVSNLGATVPATLFSSLGSATITVNSPTALSPLSNALTIAINNPPVPTLTAVSPSYGPIYTATKITLTGTGFTTSSTMSLNGTQVTTTYNSSTSLSASLLATSLTLPDNYSFTVTTPAPGGGTSNSQVFSAYIPLVSNSMVYNPVDGLIYASIPGSVASPTGNSIVSVNPATGAIGTPIFVGSEPNELALTNDGRYLWVGLDGASAVRKVDLVAKTAGLQFSLPLVNGGIYDSPAKPQALAALPGATDSVVVALSNSNLSANIGLAIFDSGVPRANTASSTIYNNAINAIQIDDTRSEIYAGGSSTYDTFAYNSSGLTKKVALTNITPASYTQDEMQLVSGKIFTDFGQVYDAEAGALLGTFYVSGQTVAQGTTLADATLAKVFLADNSGGYPYTGVNQIQIFSMGDYTSAGIAIPVSVPSSSSVSPYKSVFPRRLARWGANGLVFHTLFGIYSLRSNSVANLSSTFADLATTMASGGSTNTSGNTSFIAQVTNSGPSTATEVVLTAQTPGSGMLVSVTSTVGSCTTGTSVTCALGSMASGSTATVVFTVFQTTAGMSTMTAQVTGSTTDPNAANNSASVSATIVGSSYNVLPMLTSISPAAMQTGTSTDTKLTVNGAGFSSASTVMLASSALATSFLSSTQLTATVPAANVLTMGWAPVTVSTPAPGGGTSSRLPLTFYNVITIGVNHILYDPYSRHIMASVGSGSSSVIGNSIAAIDPENASLGTPVSIGSQPTNLALSSDGQMLYTILAGSQSIARYNMLSGQPDFTYQVPTNSSFIGGIALRGIAVQPGTENTIALDIASFTGNAIYDFDPAKKTAAIRGQASGPYSGSCVAFLGAGDLLAFDTDTSGSTLDHYSVTSAGFTYYNYSQYNESTLNNFGCFKLSGGLAYANGGGIANPSTRPATQIAVLAGARGGGFSNSRAMEPDASLQRAFYPATNTSSIYTTAGQDGITVFDLNTYLPVMTLPLNMQTIEGSTGYSQVDVIRWGQDGLAILTSTGHIYLLRGPVIVPELMASGGPAASLSSVSAATLAKGAGNVMLALYGSNFAPGVAVTWNGSYRTTTIVDATHVSVAIPASDLAAVGSGSLVAINPGAAASNSMTVTVQ